MAIFAAIGFLLVLLLTFSLLDLPLYLALLSGVLPFVYLARHQGTSWSILYQGCVNGLSKLSKIYLILFLIGPAIALWMASGTLPFLIQVGVSLIHPKLFLLFVFILTWAITLLLGSALGAAGMVGSLFMAMATASGYSLPMTAGAVVSAIYLGERSSPLSSCANLVAEITHQPIVYYIKTNIRNSMPSILLTLLLYTCLSIAFPLTGDSHLLQSAIASTFNLNFIVLLPVFVLVIILIIRKQIATALIFSMLVSILVSIFIQGESLNTLMDMALGGYRLPADHVLFNSLKTSGLFGMINAILTVMASALYSGIFQTTDLLMPIQQPIERLCLRTSRSLGLLISSILGSMIGCSQTFALLFGHQLIRDQYTDTPEDQAQLASDLANTGVLMPALIPWNAACSIPASLLGSGFGFIPFAFILFLAPLEMLLKLRYELVLLRHSR